MFQVEFDSRLLAEHLAIHLFSVVSKNDHDVVIKKNEGFTNNDILQYFINKGLTVRSFNEVLPSLKDIFIRLVEGTSTARQFEKVST